MDGKSREIVTSELLMAALEKTVEMNRQGKAKVRMMDTCDVLAVFMRRYQLSEHFGG